MSRVILRKTNIIRRKLRVRKKIFGTPEKPRISVFRSNKFVYAQLIDDKNGKTIAASSSAVKGSPLETGKDLAKKALKAGIKVAIFDRNGYRYHGRVKGIADGAREGGLII